MHLQVIKCRFGMSQVVVAGDAAVVFAGHSSLYSPCLFQFQSMSLGQVLEAFQVLLVTVAMAACTVDINMTRGGMCNESNVLQAAIAIFLV